jgi:hypothetical protein
MQPRGPTHPQQQIDTAPATRQVEVGEDEGWSSSGRSCWASSADAIATYARPHEASSRFNPLHQIVVLDQKHVGVRQIVDRVPGGSIGLSVCMAIRQPCGW